MARSKPSKTLGPTLVGRGGAGRRLRCGQNLLDPLVGPAARRRGSMAPEPHLRVAGVGAPAQQSRIDEL